MSYYSLEAIRASCFVLQKAKQEGRSDVVGDLVPIVEIDPWEPNLGKAKCCILLEQKIDAGIVWGCREVTAVSPTGCPLRNGDTIKVDITKAASR